MPKRKEDEIEEVELADNEEFISRDDLDIEVIVSNDEPTIYVKFRGFDDDEDAAEYADFLASTLPLLLFETTRFN